MAKIYKDKSGSWYSSTGYLTEKQQKFNANAIVNFCKNLSIYNWSDNSICALLGNVSAESGLNPILNETGGSGYGLVQWTPKSKLINRAKSIGRGNSYDTMYTQLLVIDYECKNNLQWITTSDYPISFEQFITDTTHSIEWLTGAWLKNYERPADQSQANIDIRCTGDNNGHIGSLQWATILDFSNTAGGSIAGFIAWCEKIANDNSYLYKIGSAHGVPWNYDGKYFDCSSFISFGLHNGGGYALDTQFSTANQKQELSDLGFNIFAYTSKKNVEVGDIVFFNNGSNGHTEAVYSVDDSGANQLVGARTDTLPPNEQIAIHNWYEGGWQWVARPSGSNPPPAQSPYTYKRRPMVFVYPIMT